MPDGIIRYPRYRFPPAIISHAVWLYYRFTLSFGDVEDLLAQRGIIVSYETVRHWCQIFGLASRGGSAVIEVSSATRGIWTRCS